MHFALTEDQQLFRDAVHDALKAACTADRVRAAWTTPDASLWSLVADLGVLGLEVPTDGGGMGLGMVETTTVLVEAGRFGFPGPLIETLAAAPLLATHDPPLTDALVAGQAKVGMALPDAPIPHADEADLVLVVHPDQTRRFSAPEAVSVASVDGARPLFEVRGATEPYPADPQQLFDRAALGTAACLLGLGERVLELAVDYAKQRRQFGRPIGSFQAVQHALSDALLALRFATPPLWRAAGSLDSGHPDASVDVSAAKAMATDAAHKAARVALQVHGAIGYTHEYDLHLFHKRVLALAPAWGDATWHRERIAHHLELPGAVHA